MGNDTEERACFTGVLWALGRVSKEAEVICSTGVVVSPSGIAGNATEVEGKLYEE